MPTEREEHVYTVEQYTKLNEEQKDALALVAGQLGVELEEEPVRDEELSDALGILVPTDGCVPSAYAADDIVLSIRKKFACIFHAACETVERRGRQAGRENNPLAVVIDPSYEDVTHVAVCDYRSPGRCYLHRCYRAWSYAFDGLSEIADEVLELAGRIEAADRERA